MVVQELLEDAMSECLGMYSSNAHQTFYKIYPFTTENIDGYMDYFDVSGKSILTVGSSGDQVINNAIRGAGAQTVIDICPNTKLYFYLKKAGLLELSYQEFMQFFRFKNYPMLFKTNDDVFSQELFLKMKDRLQELDSEVYYFWDNLFSLFPADLIRRRLFVGDEYQNKVLKIIDSYLSDEECYDMAKSVISSVEPEFVIHDLTDFGPLPEDLENYDFINLSNLGTWWERNTTKRVVDKLVPYLNPDGNILICYLYDTLETTPYERGMKPIYNIPDTKEVFSEYALSFYPFLWIEGIKCNNDDQDSVMVYQKSCTH